MSEPNRLAMLPSDLLNEILSCLSFDDSLIFRSLNREIAAIHGAFANRFRRIVSDQFLCIGLSPLLNRLEVLCIDYFSVRQLSLFVANFSGNLMVLEIDNISSLVQYPGIDAHIVLTFGLLVMLQPRYVRITASIFIFNPRIARIIITFLTRITYPHLHIVDAPFCDYHYLNHDNDANLSLGALSSLLFGMDDDEELPFVTNAFTRSTIEHMDISLNIFDYRIGCDTIAQIVWFTPCRTITFHRQGPQFETPSLYIARYVVEMLLAGVRHNCLHEIVIEDGEYTWLHVMMDEWIIELNYDDFVSITVDEFDVILTPNIGTSIELY